MRSLIVALLLAFAFGQPALAASYQASTVLAAQALFPKLKAGDSLCLLPGSYGPIAVQKLALLTGQAILRPCTAGTVTVAGLALYQTRGLAVSGFGITAYKAAAVRCYGCVWVSFDGLKIVGSQPNPGITIDGGSQIAITNSAVVGTSSGISFSRGVSGWRVEAADVSGVIDGVFISNSPNGLVQGLYCHDFKWPIGAHSDCVQGTTKGGTQSLDNLTIEHVRFVRRGGQMAQGVFLADEGFKGYRNAQVRFGCIVGGFDNGEMVVNGDAASSITDSVVIGLKDQRSSIYRTGKTQVLRNLANAYKFSPVDPSNKITPQVVTEAEALKLCP